MMARLLLIQMATHQASLRSNSNRIWLLPHLTKYLHTIWMPLIRLIFVRCLILRTIWLGSSRMTY